MNTEKEIKKVAKVLMLKPSPQLLRHLCKSWDSITKAVLRLNAINTKHVKPMVFPNPNHTYHLRKDVLTPSTFDPTVVQQNAPSHEKGFLLVPRVVPDAE